METRLKVTYRLLMLVTLVAIPVLVSNLYAGQSSVVPVVMPVQNTQATALPLPLAVPTVASLRQEQPTITKVALQVQEEDGSVLVRPGELLLRPNAKGTVLLCHGFKRDLTDTRVIRTLFPEYNTLIFDFRAHGAHKGSECCSFGQHEVRDIQAAVQFIREHEKLRDLPLFGYGMSMGAATLILAQAQDPLFDALILDSPFDAMENVINTGLERLTFSIGGYDMAAPLKKVLSWYAFNPNMNGTLKFLLKTVGMDATDVATCIQPVKPAQAIAQVQVPCFIIGCEADQQVPKDAFVRVHAAAPSTGKQLWISAGRGHVDSYFSQPEEYREKITAFLNAMLDQLAKNPSSRLVYKSKR